MVAGLGGVGWGEMGVGWTNRKPLYSCTILLLLHCLPLLLPPPLQVQLQQNKRKTEALKDLLATTTEAGGGGEGGDGGGCEERSANSRAREDCGKASAALQQLLDQLLDSNIAASADAS